MRQRPTLVRVPYHFDKAWDIIPNRVGTWLEVTSSNPEDHLQPPPLFQRLAFIDAAEPDVVVSGDCMCALTACPSGSALIWFDAHGDCNTISSTRSGSIGGMPLAMIMGIEGRSLMTNLRHYSKPTEVIHVGGVEFDQGESRRMCTLGITVLKQLYAEDLASIYVPIHLHLDLDVIGSLWAPWSIHASEKGMSLELFWEQMQLVLPKASTLSIKTFNPHVDIDGAGERITLKLVDMFLRTASLRS